METKEDTNAQGKITFRCAQCGKRLSALKSKIGSQHVCPYCGFSNLISQQSTLPPSAPAPSDSGDSGVTSPEPSTSEPTPHPQEPKAKQQAPSSWKKKESAFITYFLLGTALIFCLISIILFSKTLSINIDTKSSSNGIENMLVDKEAEQSIYTPADITGEKIGLENEMDQEAAEKLQNAAKMTSAMPEESDIQEIHTLFKKFSAEKDLNKRLELVFSPEEMKPFMEKWEKEFAPVPSTPDMVIAANHTPPLMLVRFSTGMTTQKDVVFIHDAKSGQWKIDWPSLVGYSEHGGKKLTGIRPANPVPVRVTLSMGDKYEAPFLERPDASNYEGKSYMSINITFPDGQELSGFVDRHSDMALELSKKLMMGPTQAMIKLHFPSDPAILNKNIVIIDEFIRDNWLSDKANDLLKKAIPQSQQR